MIRIKAITHFITPVDTIIDIGTDHGYVIIEAFRENKILKAIATDINEGPLKRAKQNIIDAGFSHKTTFLKTDGFFEVKEKFDAVIITGLGYKTVERILKTKHHIPKYYIFGIQRQLPEFRLFLSNHGFKITDEIVVFDKKYYVFIKAVKENENLSKEDQVLGPILKTKTEALPYYQSLYLKTKENEKRAFGKLDLNQKEILRILSEFISK